MVVVIDGKESAVAASDRNIVDVADRNGIGIPAPCYRARPRNGCCRVCVVEVDDSIVYACCTEPREGMQIAVNREDLNLLRKERIRQYREGAMQGEPCDCSCGCTDDSSEEGCCC